MKLGQAILAAAALGIAAASLPARAEEPGLYLYESYRPDADPSADLELAKSRAAAEGKRILVEVGGDWCSWCHILDRYIEASDEVKDAFAASFVVLKVNWASDDSRNEEFLAQYPDRGGYPHFYVLEADGTFLHSQDTVELEDGGRSYDKGAMLSFARRWRTPAS